MSPMSKKLVLGVAVSLPAIAAASCSVGPDYAKPSTDIPSTFRAQVSAGEASSLADLTWWSLYNDPQLEALVSEALAHNYDLQLAVARIEQARALVGVAKSQAFPQVGYEGFVGGEQAFIPQQNIETQSYGFVGAVIDATWEFDLWGRIRRSTEAAEANLLAQEYARRGVRLTLVSDVAAGYFRLLELDRQLAISRDSFGAYGKTFDLFTLRFEAGRDNKLPVDRAQAARDSSTASIEAVTREIAQQENALSILVGANPRQIARGQPLTAQTLPPTAVGATSDLLQRRPDILQAEQSMIAANAEIGVAVANYFPRIGLSAFIGGQGVDLEDDSGSFGIWNIALSAAGPIFTGGRLDSVYRSRQAYWDETVAQYRKTVLGAFREVSDALIAQQTLERRRIALQRQVAALESSVDLALTRYDGGRASYFEVLEAQQELYPAQSALAQTQLDQLLATVALYKALGGGWRATDAEWLQPQ